MKGKVISLGKLCETWMNVCIKQKNVIIGIPNFTVVQVMYTKTSGIVRS